ncbi:hypothetical protein [Mesorhizobium sp. M4A.F.Ca.ET.022.05.2.1]|uniref:hypothetical protein n=1 Tax=Mesorhizobium sp. M4A.F.Ca.ET.022.05.2.1 TaxID=2496653 RepID=UPI0016785DF4|nr:hypothetical protein [Mesorhizobium sp. M4A.F.Ca.ET.022.05.2.1]
MRDQDGLPLGQRQKLAGIILNIVRCYAEPPEPPRKLGDEPFSPSPSPHAA